MNARNSLLTIAVVVAVVVAGICIYYGGVSDDSVSNQTLDPSQRLKQSQIEDSSSVEGTVLDETRQRYIWTAEHVTFEIETYVGKHLKDSLKQRDREGLRNIFRPGFIGTRIDSQEKRTVSVSGVTEEIWEHQQPEPNNADEFTTYLLACFDSFTSIEKVGMRVLRIDAREGDPERGDWDIQTLISGFGTSADGKRLYFTQHGNACISFSSDAEIRNSAVIASWEITDESLVTSPVLMREATSQFGLDQLGIRDNWQDKDRIGAQYSHFLAVADYDHDGLPDIAVSTLSGNLMLLRVLPDGGTDDVTDKVGLLRNFFVANQQTLVTWIDIDNDGFSDLLAGKELFRNVQGQRFEWLRNTGLKLKHHPRGAAVADFDCDGLLDLYVTYSDTSNHGGDAQVGWINDNQSGVENQLWKNNGDGTFEDVTAAANAGGGLGKSFAAVWFHANEDLYPDLYVANDFGINSLLVNNGDGTFSDISNQSRTADYATSMGAAVGDIDGDGQTDIYVANMYSKMGRRIVNQVRETDYRAGIYEHLLGACAGNRLYLNQGSGKSFEEVSQSLHLNGVGWAYSPAFADFDLDGFLDIYATTGFISYRRDRPDG